MTPSRANQRSTSYGKEFQIVGIVIGMKLSATDVLTGFNESLVQGFFLFNYDLSQSAH